MSDEVTVEKTLQNLRAQNWDEYVGQEKLKRSLEIAMQAAKERGEVLDHVLLYGPPGLGKTTMAGLVAKMMGVSIKTTSGPAITRTGDLASILSNLEEGDVLFIDEIHRLNKVVEETLYPAMEDFALDIVLGKGPAARSLRLELPRFTLIGATTRAGALAAPLRDRFGVSQRLTFYKDEELVTILRNAAEKLNMEAEDEALHEVAKRSRKTARVALKLLRRVRDFGQVKKTGKVTRDIADEALQMLEIDQLGLDATDRKLLKVIIEKHQGGPVGVETLAALVQEDKETLIDMYEPFLMRLGMLKRTHRGRTATSKAYSHLGIKRRKS